SARCAGGVEGGRCLHDGTGGAGSVAGRPDLVQCTTATSTGLPATTVGPVCTAGRSLVVDVTNSSTDYAYNGTIQLQHRFADNYEGSIAYTYSRAFDAYSYASSTAQSQYRFSRPTGLDQNDQSASRSQFEE